MGKESIKALLEFAKSTAWEAGRLTLGSFQTGLAEAEFKADDSPVTAADRAAEAHIRTRIEARYPHHGLVGEEYGESDGAFSHRWIIDPIDGTKSFMRGVPLYGVLLALEVEGRCDVGAAYFPALDEMIAAGTGLGATWNGRPCRVSGQTELSRAFVAHADTASFEPNEKLARWEALQRATYYRVGWSDCYGYALVATGRAEIMVDPVMNVWDCGPFLPILREAGGYFGDWSGDERIDGGEALATNGELLPQILELWKGLGEG